MENDRIDIRRNLILRRALEMARDAVQCGDLERARLAIFKTAGLGPLRVRPTRVLWEIASCLRKSTQSDNAQTIDLLFDSPDLGPSLGLGDSFRYRGDHLKALAHYRQALAVCPLSPVAIFCVGITYMELGDLTEASGWLCLVPEILVLGEKSGVVTRQLIADSLLNLAKIELLSGHRARAMDLAHKALDCRPDFLSARTFLSELDTLTSEPLRSPE